MNPDIFSPFLSPSLRSDTGLLVETHFRFALECTEPLLSLQDRFTVALVGVNKAGTVASHESLSVWVHDNVDNKEHTFVIERNPSNRTHAAAFLYFSQCPESRAVLESIQGVLRNMQSLSAQATTEALESLSTMMLPTNSQDEDEDESIPLLPIIDDTLSELPNATPTSSTPQTEASKKSLGDVISLTLVRAAAAARVASGSSIPQTLADDTISGIDKLNPNNCIRLFKPQNLPFFNLILLADVIHHFAPIYSLFENQCFWFANLLFEYIVRYHTLPASAYAPVAASSSSSAGPVPAPTPAVGTPNNADKIILPMRSSSHEAGRWMGILISDPAIRLTVIKLVQTRFERRLQYYMDQVTINFEFFNCLLRLNPQRYRHHSCHQPEHRHNTRPGSGDYDTPS